MIKVKATNTNFTALDIGSSKVSILAADISPIGDARIGYQSISHSSGIRAGEIFDFKQAENSIINAIYNLEKSIDKRINNVSISLSGMGCKSLYIYQKIRLIEGKVSKNDIKTLISKGLERFEDSSVSVLHYFPIEYTLDQNNSINNPLGMYGNVLGCRIHVVLADSLQVSNLISCFAKCHISVKEIVVGSYASSLAVLTEDEKSLGSVLIDFGSSTTSYSIFSGGQLIFTGFIPYGGNHITSDIAKVLSISMQSAEKLKVMYGSALSSSDNDNMINLSEFEHGANFDYESSISPTDLSMIINARVEEIIEILKSEYDKLGVDHLIGRRIVLTGGGSSLRGIKEVVSTNFKKQVRIGSPVIIPGFDSDHTIQSYTSVLGLVKNEMVKLKKSSPFSESSTGLIQKISSWFKEGI